MDSGETKIFIAVLLASVIIASIIICFFILTVRSHRKYLRLQHSQLTAEINALESERKRIVSDLHDELGPLLAAVKFQLITLDTTLTRDLERIGKASVNVDAVLSRMREICHHMIPDILTRKGLFVAVNEFIEDVNTRTSMHIVFNCQPAPVSLHMQLHIYRMIQEMITNAVRHSGGTRMSINIALKNDRLMLEVTDNGKGFDTGANYTSSGLGIKNIFGRTRLLHGDMYLNSGFGMGTTYNIEIPIACNELQDTIDDRG